MILTEIDCKFVALLKLVGLRSTRPVYQLVELTEIGTLCLSNSRNLHGLHEIFKMMPDSSSHRKL